MRRLIEKSNIQRVYLRLILAMGMVMALATPVFAEEEAPNNAMKAVFFEVKKELSGNEMLQTISMIAGVLAIVGVAMYISFKTPDNSLK